MVIDGHPHFTGEQTKTQRGVSVVRVGSHPLGQEVQILPVYLAAVGTWAGRFPCLSLSFFSVTQAGAGMKGADTREVQGSVGLCGLPSSVWVPAACAGPEDCAETLQGNGVSGRAARSPTRGAVAGGRQHPG